MWACLGGQEEGCGLLFKVVLHTRPNGSQSCDSISIFVKRYVFQNLSNLT